MSVHKQTDDTTLDRFFELNKDIHDFARNALIAGSVSYAGNFILTKPKDFTKLPFVSEAFAGWALLVIGAGLLIMNFLAICVFLIKNLQPVGENSNSLFRWVIVIEVIVVMIPTLLGLLLAIARASVLFRGVT